MPAFTKGLADGSAPKRSSGNVTTVSAASLYGTPTGEGSSGIWGIVGTIPPAEGTSGIFGIVGTPGIGTPVINIGTQGTAARAGRPQASILSGGAPAIVSSNAVAPPSSSSAPIVQILPPQHIAGGGTPISPRGVLISSANGGTPVRNQPAGPIGTEGTSGLWGVIGSPPAAEGTSHMLGVPKGALQPGGWQAQNYPGTQGTVGRGQMVTVTSGGPIAVPVTAIGGTPSYTGGAGTDGGTMNNGGDGTQPGADYGTAATTDENANASAFPILPIAAAALVLLLMMGAKK